MTAGEPEDELPWSSRRTERWVVVGTALGTTVLWVGVLTTGACWWLG